MFLFLFLVFFFFYLYTMNKRYIHIHAWQLLNKIIKILKSGSTKTTGTNYCICWSCFQSHSPPSLLFFFFFKENYSHCFGSWILSKGKAPYCFQKHILFLFFFCHCFTVSHTSQISIITTKTFETTHFTAHYPCDDFLLQ